MKRYFVLMRTETFQFTFRSNSWKIVKWLADLKFWNYAKIHDGTHCVYINDKRA